MIKNVKKEEVFTLLSKGKTVCALHRENSSKFCDLTTKTIRCILNYLKTDDYEYFVIEEEGAGAVYG